MATNEITLPGCSPTPLASYLKALGVLRLIVSSTSNASGTAADPQARGWWESERFHLHTRLDREALTRFFLEDYAPSPIIAPWNGGSGFYPGDQKEGIESFTEANVANRFVLLANTIQAAIHEINRRGFNPQLKLIVGNQTRLADCSHHSKNTLEFRYRISADDVFTNDICIGDDALRPNQARITDKSGKKQLSLGGRGEDGALVVLNLKITSSPKNGYTYTAGDIVRVKVIFSEDVKVEARPEKTDKAPFVAGLRGRLPDAALGWLDATLALSGDKLSFPQLLGTGGNDGRLDFTNNFMQRLATTLFDISTGKPTGQAARLLGTALFADGTWGFHKVAIGQFAPGAAGGPNATTGYEADANVNPWDFVLALEGAMMFAGAATRRHQGSPELGASFPFTVRPTGAGWGGVADSDEGSARAEFWAPMWNQPAGYDEIGGLLKEGRAVLNRKTARDGLDFARAAASLGISRGVSAFARYGFVMRSGKAYLAAPLGTLSVSSHATEGAELISDLDTGSWLSRVRRLARGKDTPTRARTAIKQLEDALFAMSGAHISSRTVQGALGALGDLVRWLKNRKDAHGVPPPPRLSYKWVRMADDGTSEYRVAAALASLGWPRRDAPAEGEVQRTDTVDRKERIALAAHFAPISAETVPKRWRIWDAQNESRVVWGAGGLESNLIAVLQRRLIDVAIDAPLEAAAAARLEDVVAYLEGDFDDTRCARLLAGLVWVRPALRLSSANYRRYIVPFAYAALKPIFAPATSLKALAERQLIPPDCKLRVPPGLVSQLRSGHVEEAVQLALARARASGISCPFDGSGTSLTTATGRRLSAALLIPLDKYGLQALMERAYPAEKENENVH